MMTQWQSQGFLARLEVDEVSDHFWQPGWFPAFYANQKTNNGKRKDWFDKWFVWRLWLTDNWLDFQSQATENQKREFISYRLDLFHFVSEASLKEQGF